MGTYNYIQRTFFKTVLYIGDLFRGPETADEIYIARKILQPVSECIVMLQRKYGSRNKYCYLLAVRNSFESRPDSHFRLSEPYIPAYEPVHRAVILHIGFNCAYRLLLIRSVLIHERRFKLLLHVSVGGKGETFGTLAFRVKLYQILGNILYLGLSTVLKVLPCLRPQLVYLRRLSFL